MYVHTSIRLKVTRSPSDVQGVHLASWSLALMYFLCLEDCDWSRVSHLMPALNLALNADFEKKH